MGAAFGCLMPPPSPDYQPINREAKVLTAMKGRLWIDKREYQWVKVSAEVTRPVSMYWWQR